MDDKNVFCNISIQRVVLPSRGEYRNYCSTNFVRRLAADNTAQKFRFSFVRSPLDSITSSYILWSLSVTKEHKEHVRSIRR